MVDQRRYDEVHALHIANCGNVLGEALEGFTQGLEAECTFVKILIIWKSSVQVSQDLVPTLLAEVADPSRTFSLAFEPLNHSCGERRKASSD